MLRLWIENPLLAVLVHILLIHSAVSWEDKGILFVKHVVRMRVVLLIINVVYFFYCKLTLFQENNTKNVELCLVSTSKPKLSQDFINRQITLQEHRHILAFFTSRHFYVPEEFYFPPQFVIWRLHSNCNMFTMPPSFIFAIVSVKLFVYSLCFTLVPEFQS